MPPVTTIARGGRADGGGMALPSLPRASVGKAKGEWLLLRHSSDETKPVTKPGFACR
jgi:hypothetical protein